MPADPLYQPIQVGAAGKDPISPSWLRDDEGDNISERNKSFCELTGLYWAWKHIDAEVYGLCHYRRYFAGHGHLRNKDKRLIDAEEIDRLLDKVDVILPRKRHYFIETRESQYVHAHHAEDFRVTEAVLRESCPEYLPAWQDMLNSRSGHICNMFIMRRELFMEYCEWLFGILFEVEKRLDTTGYSEYDSRVFGFVAERLLDVWVETKRLKYTEVPVMVIENEHWPRKIAAFLRRKIKGGKD
ncbi:MAG: DUF4422 domain-containing protein [Ruminiclostridium sp.]|nr:DUF4422 domain-containing protein [Ruminiclostridium sp.]